MLRSKTSVLLEADTLLHKDNFTREDSARIESMFSFADRLPNIDETTVREQRLDAPLPKNREFMAYLSVGKEGLEPDRRAAMQQEIQNALSTTDAAGGYICPQPFVDRLESLVKQYDGIFDAATLWEPNNGMANTFPLLDDSGQSAAIVGQNQASADGTKDVVFAGVDFPSVPTWRSGLISVPWELVNDSAFDFQTLLASAFAGRFARGIGASFITELLASATSGVTTTSASVIDPDEVLSLIDSVDAAYQNGGAFLMRRATLTTLQKLKFSNGLYVWGSQINPATGRPMIAGYDVYISPNMPAIAGNAKVICFGRLQNFVRRSVKNSLILKTLVEHKAELGMTCYESYLRCDGKLAKSTNVMPIKYMTIHS